MCTHPQVFPSNARVDYAMITEFHLQMADLSVCISSYPMILPLNKLTGRLNNFTINLSHPRAAISHVSQIFLVHCTIKLIDKTFLIIKPTRCTNFSKLFLEWNSTCFGQFLCPSSRVFHCTHSNGVCHTGLLTACEQEHLLLLTSCQKTCMTYTIAVCTVKNSWWWTEELSEICRVSFQE